MIFLVEHKTDTGGLLNTLNGKMGISSPYNSVPVIKLINTHHPKSYDELEQLIEYHYLNDCPCGIKSKGTVYDFGRNLYESQIKYFKDYLFTLEECVQWEYDLFIVNSLKGSKMEKLARNEVRKAISPRCKVEKTERVIDEEYRIDLEIMRDGEVLLGVQVKPYSYKFTNDYVKGSNVVRNSSYGYDVFYLYYDDDGVFFNVGEISDLL